MLITSQIHANNDTEISNKKILSFSKLEIIKFYLTALSLFVIFLLPKFATFFQDIKKTSKISKENF